VRAAPRPEAEAGRGSLGALLEALDRLARKRPARAASCAPAPAAPTLVARSRAMADLLRLLERTTSSRATVLVIGETGTGKELLARAIHDGSRRRSGPFVAVNCAAFPDTLLESELFGHVKGAFTGADRTKPGLFEAAEGGTLFLDEVGETSPPLQAKLLRALQEREVRPVGGARARRVDVRVVAATNRDLRRAVRKGVFRDDLYYRLAVFLLQVPPLRERREDIGPLAEHFLRRHGEREGKPGCRLGREAADLLQLHPWPGNVRELENEMQRALALAEPGETVGPHHLSERVTNALDPVREAGREGESLRQALERIEAWLIRRALDDHGGRRAATARTLGVTREGLYKKMRRLGIE
jgi:transcriptional regulator with PAS, ATPase and Fis domain